MQHKVISGSTWHLSSLDSLNSIHSWLLHATIHYAKALTGSNSSKMALDIQCARQQALQQY